MSRDRIIPNGNSGISGVGVGPGDGVGVGSGDGAAVGEGVGVGWGVGVGMSSNVAVIVCPSATTLVNVYGAVAGAPSIRTLAIW